MDIGYLGAFLGGLLSLLSPCSAMLLPAFFAYAFSRPALLVARTGVFYLGLVTTLVPLGVSAATAGAFLSQQRGTLLTAVAIVVIVFGLVQVLSMPVPAFGRTGQREPGTAWTVFLPGAAYGVAGVCTGPILGSVLMIAAAGANPVYGAILLAIYAAGMALPLLLLALAWKRWSGSLRTWLRHRMLRLGRWTNSWHAIISGTLSLVLGALLLITAHDPEATGLLPIGTQYALETGIARLGADISNVAVVIAAVLIALAGTFWLLRRHRSRTGPTAGTDAPAVDSPATPPQRTGQP
ncbi:Cytochrome c biogenesis protein CcdA [Streptosporangium canum]|uniref:Cytochrome c biogenesis protein CcdA n=1 Tax=Streptosporangium canum TaxID=324952 RepID=A0A1I4BX47_9ACTN|nr:cytochrome c biogenesis CcdA family protein [Streptosporangium canum]SFK73093.1 Cytochrome c biogenesis protein CcdA [Streptosporangium canum]